MKYLCLFCACLYLLTPLRAQTELEVFGSSEKIPFSLVGYVYYLPVGTSQLPKYFDTRKSVGKVYTNRLEIKQRSFLTGFPGITERYEWFAIDYHGFFAIDSAEAYEFALLSDDGSKLYIDGQLIVNNDGVHSAVGKRGKIFLSEGVHRINVQYFQGPRDQIALTLFYSTPDNQYFNVFDFEYFKPVNFYAEDSLKDKDVISLAIANSILFAYDDFVLKEEAKLVLDEIINSYLIGKPQKGLIIEGHTDNKGSEEYNMKLSVKRATSVRNYIEASTNLSGRVWIKGYGEQKPKNNNSTEKKQAENRRVELLIMDKDKIDAYLK